MPLTNLVINRLLNCLQIMEMCVYEIMHAHFRSLFRNYNFQIPKKPKNLILPLKYKISSWNFCECTVVGAATL